MGIVGNEGNIGKGSELESKAASDLMGKTTKKLHADPTDLERQKQLLEADLKAQQEVEEYNLDLENATSDRRFANRLFVGNSIIIKLEKINFLIPSDINPDLHTFNSLYIVRVATPDFPSGKNIINPLPYNYRGVVVALGDEAIKYRQENGLKPIEIGDIVELNWFDMKNFRYYPDKQRIDLISPDSPEAPNFEGFVKVPTQFVEAIIKESEFELVHGVSREEYYRANASMETMNLDNIKQEVIVKQLTL